jgi:hypothetical protein
LERLRSQSAVVPDNHNALACCEKLPGVYRSDELAIFEIAGRAEQMPCFLITTVLWLVVKNCRGCTGAMRLPVVPLLTFV